MQSRRTLESLPRYGIRREFVFLDLLGSCFSGEDIPMRAMVECARFVKCFGCIYPFAENTVLTLMNALSSTLLPIVEGASDNARFRTQEVSFLCP